MRFTRGFPVVARRSWTFPILSTTIQRMSTIGWDSPEDWARLGKRIAAERVALGLSQRNAAKAAGIGETTLRDLELGHKKAVRPLILTALSIFLGWGPDGAFQILMGGEPTPKTVTDREGLTTAALLDLDEKIATLHERLSSVERLLVRLVGEGEGGEPTPQAGQ